MSRPIHLTRQLIDRVEADKAARRILVGIQNSRQLTWHARATTWTPLFRT